MVASHVLEFIWMQTIMVLGQKWQNQGCDYFMWVYLQIGKKSDVFRFWHFNGKMQTAN